MPEIEAPADHSNSSLSYLEEGSGRPVGRGNDYPLRGRRHGRQTTTPLAELQFLIMTLGSRVGESFEEG